MTGIKVIANIPQLEKLNKMSFKNLVDKVDLAL